MCGTVCYLKCGQFTIYGNISLVQLIDDRAVCHQYASGTYANLLNGPSQPLSVYHLDIIEISNNFRAEENMLLVLFILLI